MFSRSEQMPYFQRAAATAAAQNVIQTRVSRLERQPFMTRPVVYNECLISRGLLLLLLLKMFFKPRSVVWNDGHVNKGQSFQTTAWFPESCCCSKCSSNKGQSFETTSVCDTVSRSERMTDFQRAKVLQKYGQSFG